VNQLAFDVRRGALRLIFSILTAIVVLIAAVVFIGPMFISTEELRNQLFAQVEANTGYRLRVSGPVDITFFPSLDLVAEDVGVAQPATGSDAEFATAQKLKFGLMLRGLLDGKMRVTEVTLVDPVIAVPQNTAAASGDAASDAAQGAPAGGGASGTAGIAEKLKNLTLDKLVIENGTVILPASGGEAGKRIEKLNLDASLPGYDAPLSFETSAVFDGKAMEANGSIGAFGQFLEGAPAPVRITASAPGMLEAPVSVSGTASYKNDAVTLTQFSAKSGDKTLSGTAVYKDDTATLSQFTATMGRDTFAGNAVYKDNIVTINPLRANVRGTVLAGQVSANLANQVPYVVAALAAKTLDVNAMMGTAKSKPSTGGGGGGGKKATAGWSNDKIDFSPLKAVNGKFSISAEQLIYDQIVVAPVTLQAALNGGKLNATLSKFKLYDGTGDIAIAVDASGKTPAQRVKLSLAKFDAYPFLRDAAGFERLQGRGTVSMDLSGYGASQRAIVSALSGNANLEFANGAIRGVNVAKMIRSLGTGVVEGWQGNEAEKTDFASLGATFKVAKGQATTKDLHLVGPLVRMNGAGTVDLPGQTLKFRVDPQLVASLEGQGGKKDMAGLGVPVMITGPWSHPKFYPDIKGILENPAEAYQRYKEFSKGVKNLPGLDGTGAGALSNVIKDGKVDKDALIGGIGGLLGGTQAAPTPETDAAATPETQPKADKSNKKKSAKKKKNKQQTQKLDAEDAAKQLLDNFLTGQ
jgi:AsmA protein